MVDARAKHKSSCIPNSVVSSRFHPRWAPKPIPLSLHPDGLLALVEEPEELLLHLVHGHLLLLREVLVPELAVVEHADDRGRDGEPSPEGGVLVVDPDPGELVHAEGGHVPDHRRAAVELLGLREVEALHPGPPGDLGRVEGHVVGRGGRELVGDHHLPPRDLGVDDGVPVDLLVLPDELGLVPRPLLPPVVDELPVLDREDGPGAGAGAGTGLGAGDEPGRPRPPPVHHRGRCRRRHHLLWVALGEGPHPHPGGGGGGVAERGLEPS
mmetsp:Transcript_12223/g.30087  ORF Transcript_12223/g.30087 Transcript_12223/m.30087 type:complete len:268 (+) Transcript_12223:356-1159(+)